MSIRSFIRNNTNGERITTMGETRDSFFDNAKFFLIILVVIGHAMEIVGVKSIILCKILYNVLPVSH